MHQVIDTPPKQFKEVLSETGLLWSLSVSAVVVSSRVEGGAAEAGGRGGSAFLLWTVCSHFAFSP